MRNKKYISHFSLASVIRICFFFATVACRLKKNFIADNQFVFEEEPLKKTSGQPTRASILSLLHPGTLEPSLGASYHPQLPTWVPLYPLLERWLVGVGYDKQILDLPPICCSFCTCLEH